MNYDATGRPSETGQFQIIDGKLKPRKIEDGERVSFDIALADNAPGPRIFHDATNEPPKTVDEALQQAFAAEAERKGYKKVSEWLAKVEPKQLDQIVAEISTSFIRGHAGQGIARHFKQDNTMLTDAEREYAVAKARAEHNLRNHHMGDAAPAFTSDMATAAINDAITAKVGESAQQMVIDASNDAQRLASEAHGARIARDYLTANAWRR